jgi:hypothetical protein
LPGNVGCRAIDDESLGRRSEVEVDTPWNADRERIRIEMDVAKANHRSELFGRKSWLSSDLGKVTVVAKHRNGIAYRWVDSPSSACRYGNCNLKSLEKQW